MMSFISAPTPIQHISDPRLEAAKVSLAIKRDDLIHPHISGNKWRKLKYNLQEAREQGQQTLLTFGGAYSNHIAATAAAGNDFGFKTIGLIRGEEHQPLNPTLQFASEQGMQLHYINRQDYRQRGEEETLAELQQRFGSFYYIPEGGSNALAVRGSAELVTELEVQQYDFIAVACGTGGTLAGIVTGLNRRRQALGFPVLKGGSFMKAEVDKLTQAYNGEVYHNYQLITDYHFGGYAKWTPELTRFINGFNSGHGVPLDPVYTGKLLFGIFDLVQKGWFKPGTRLLAIHTGGLQGIKGFNERFGDIIS
ncbi:1-aminocyclopropane-1-carboxylate deaminase/D-cysteine desulfhydrase [Cesiribacter sp. SM1]|uniref:1-aminocyclopropane-1-carboxylate deaminase/D-cysteine desulfhydrase n=1 Tax=Cesiribacter sp. SM1 TaxID=2861196 RepID=UPI001CD6E363|nr:pyridoxal-phosphate dependent enzyme [Cesiribacter sp. SM1]